MASHAAPTGLTPARQASSALGGWRPYLGSALPYLLPAPAAVIATAAGGLAHSALAAVAASAVGCALVRVIIESLRIDQVRERADTWIITHAGEPPADAVLLARIRELLGPRTRTSLASSFRRIAAEAGARPARAISPAQINRRQIRPHVPDLDRLADRLSDLREPVAPRGVALANRLVTNHGGPLYSRRRAGELPTVLSQTLHALDSR